MYLESLPSGTPLHVSCLSFYRVAGGPGGLPCSTLEDRIPQDLSSGEDDEEEEEGWEVWEGEECCAELQMCSVPCPLVGLRAVSRRCSVVGPAAVGLY